MPTTNRLTTSILALSALLLCADADRPAPAQAQPQPTAFTLAATWRSAAIPLPPGVWRRAHGVDYGADGRVYVVDAAERTVSVIDTADQPQALGDAAGAGLVAPTYIAVDSVRGRIYVSDAGAGGIVVLDPAGVKQALWPVPSAAGVATLPDGTGIAVGSSEDGTVRILNADGTQRAAWPSQATTERGDVLRGIDVDAGSRVHVLDGRNGDVRTFTLTGVRQDSVDLRLPPGVEANDVVFAGYGGATSDQRFLAATSVGIVLLSVGSQWNIIPRGDLFGIAFDAARGIVATQPGRNGEGSYLYRWLPGADRPASPERTWGELAARPGTFEGPMQVGVGADGRLVILDRQWRIQRFAPDGAVVDQKSKPWLMHAPVAVTADDAGMLFVSSGGTLAAYDPATGLVWQAQVGGGAGHAVALAIGPAPRHDVVALDTLNDAVELFDRATGRVVNTRPLPPAAVERALWGDLDMDAAGNAYALDRVNGTVAVLPLGAAGGAARTVALPPRTRRLAVTPDGQALYALDRDGWVHRFDTAGARTGSFDAARFDIAPASLPSDVSVDGAGRIFVTDQAADVVSVWRVDAAATPQSPPDGGAECRAVPGKTADPAAVRLGDAVDVRLTVRGGCGSRAAPTPLDILLVLDRSGSMEGERLRLLKEAAASFIAEVDYTTGRVGVVSFNDTAALDAPLSAQAGPPRDAVRNLQATGNTLISVGLARARQEFQQRGRADARKVIVLFSDGIEDREEGNRTLQEADQLKRTFGVEIFTVAIGGASTLMRSAATDAAHAFVADDARFLYAIFEAIAGRVTTAVLFKTITVTDRLPPDMRLVAGSIVPPATVQGDTLRWTLTDVPIAGLGLRYRVEPLECGEAPTNIAAFAEYTDGYGRAGRLDFPVPRVTVNCGPPTVQPTSTATPSPTSTVTATPSTTPTPTATRRPEPIYLPIGMRERCIPGERHADVALAVDASSSMVGAKIAAARQAARLFVSLLDLPHDQVALVAFDENARLAAPLGSTVDQLNRTLDGLATGSGTRIDRGLEVAQAELFGPRHKAGNTRVVVLLTDGRQPDESRTIELAAELRAQDVVLYAIGLGTDVDLPFLVRITGDPSRARQAPSTTELAAIYRQVAGEVPCPPSAFWGGR